MKLIELVLLKKNKKLMLFSFFMLAFMFNHKIYCQVLYPDQPYKVEALFHNKDSLGNEVLKTDELYTYNEDGEMLNYKDYRFPDGEPFLRKEKDCQYQDGEISYSKNSFFNENGEVFRKEETNYFYHDACLVTKVETRGRAHDESQKVTKYDSISCKIILEDQNYDFEGDGIFKPSTRSEWIYLGNQIEKNNYRYSSIIEAYEITDREINYLDNLERTQAVVYDYQWFPSYDSIHYHYNDEQTYPILQERFQSSDREVWTLFYSLKIEANGDSVLLSVLENDLNGSLLHTDSILYINHYNDRDLLIETEEYRRTQYVTWEEPSLGITKSFYKYDCEDRRTERVTETLGQNLKIYRFFYEENQCEEIFPDLPKEDISIFPNPANYYIDVEGELLEQEGARVELLDMKGAIIPVAYNDFSIGKVRIFLEHLYTGVYAIRVVHKDQVAVKQFLKK